MGEKCYLLLPSRMIQFNQGLGFYVNKRAAVNNNISQPFFKFKFKHELSPNSNLIVRTSKGKLVYVCVHCQPLPRLPLSCRHTFLCRSCRGKTDVPAYPAADAALSMIVAGATRQPEDYYPWFTFYVAATKDWFPSITRYTIRNSYTYEP